MITGKLPLSSNNEVQPLMNCLLIFTSPYRSSVILQIAYNLFPQPDQVRIERHYDTCYSL